MSCYFRFLKHRRPGGVSFGTCKDNLCIPSTFRTLIPADGLVVKLLLRFLCLFQFTISLATPNETTEGADHTIPPDHISYQTLSPLEQKHWRRLLFYTPSWFQGERSIVDEAGFFASPQGAKHPELEWTAMEILLKENKSPDTVSKVHPPRCLWPARLKFINLIRKQRNLILWPSDHCEQLEKWVQRSTSLEASLVFASLFPNGPGSMFGHTFLRLHRTRTAGQGAAGGYHDLVINYAAHPTTSNPFLYMILGLFGGFPGYMSAQPMYMKIQDYAQTEQRDLWEYHLSLTPDEIKWIQLSSWEVAPYATQYFYFDDNCAFIMLQLLEIARPSLSLVQDFPFWVVPTDTVRTVYDSQNLVKEVSHIPSQGRKFQARFKRLSESEKKLFADFLESKDTNELMTKTSSLNEKRSVLDTTLEFLGTEKNPENNSSDVSNESWRKEILLQRARLGGQAAEVIAEVPPEEAPHLMHRSHQIGLGAANTLGSASQKKHVVNSLLLRWRPALNAFGSAGLGLSRRMSIGFMDTQLRFASKTNTVTLDKFALINIVSTPQVANVGFSPAWVLKLGFERFYWLSTPSSFTGIRAAGGATLGPDSTYVYVLGGVDLGLQKRSIGGASDSVEKRTYSALLAPLTFAGVSLQWKTFRVIGEIHLRKDLSNIGAQNSLFLTQKLSWFLKRDLETWVDSWQLVQGEAYYSAGASTFF